MPDTLFLQELKRLILVKMGIRVISPSDCRSISISIQKELKKTVSETTIKRFFGFAEIKHEFSKFTINTLKEFVGLANDRVPNPSPNEISGTEHLDQLKSKAERLTLHTLQHIQNRCSVPYELTIARAFAHDDIRLFHDSKYSFTAFISQPGYGKSILLNHLIKELFLQPDSVFANDIIVFFNADQVFNKDLSGQLVDKIKLKLGLHENFNLFDHFRKNSLLGDSKLIVVIDGFSDLAINRNSKPIIFENLLNFIAEIENNEQVKLVLSMRSTTWSRFYEQFKSSHFFKSKWFPGSFFNLNDNSNVPPLTEVEVESIFQKMSPLDFTKISDSLKSQLKFPFHIQWYYQLREEYPAFDSYTNIIYYEIIARFIQEKIYNSTYATEKVLFCKKIIQLTNYGRIGYSVSKLDLMKEIPNFNNAYDELLANGILMEEKQVEEGISSEQVRFIQPHVFEYFLFVELYELFNQQIGDKFFELINLEYNGNQVRFQLLQWSVRLLIKLYKLREISAVLKLKLNNYEKNYLLYFIAENLNYQHQHDPRLIEEIKAQRLHTLMIRHLTNFDFIDSFYKDAVNCLIDITDNDQTALFYQSILSIFACLSVDREAIHHRMKAMEKLNNTNQHWTVDPYEIVKLIYLKITGEAVYESETLSQIEQYKALSFSNEVNAHALPNAQQIINYLLLLLVNLFYGSPQEVTKIIAAIVHQYPKLKKNRKFFSIYLLNVLAQAKARTSPGKKVDQMEKILDMIFKNEEKSNLTLYVQSLLLSLKAEQSYNRKEYVTALRYAKECLLIYKRNNLVMNELHTYKLIIKIYASLGNDAKVTEYTQLKTKVIESKNIVLPMFN